MLQKLFTGLCFYHVINFLILFPMVPTRGHAFKLYMPESRVNCRQHFFAVRVINLSKSGIHCQMMLLQLIVFPCLFVVLKT